MIERDLLRITNIKIDLTLDEDAKSKGLSAVDIRYIAFMVDAEDTTSMKMRESTPTQWVPESPISFDFPSRADGITVVLQSAEEEDFGYIFLPHVELYILLHKCRGEGKQEWSRIVEAEELSDGCSLTVSWDIEVLPSEKADIVKESAANPAHLMKELQRRMHEMFVHTNYFKNLGKVEEIEDWISFLRCAIDSLPESDPQLPFLLFQLCAALEYRFKSTGDLSSIDEAIALTSTDVDGATTPADRAASQSRLGTLYRVRFEKSAERDDIEQAVTNLQSAMDLTADQTDDMTISSWYLLSRALRIRFDNTQDVADLDRAIEVLTKSVDTTPSTHPIMPDWLEILVSYHNARHEHTKDLQSLRNAIAAQKRLIRITPPRSPSFEENVEALLAMVRAQYRESEDVEDIGPILECQRQLMACIPADRPKFSSLVFDSAFLHRRRYGITQNKADLDSAISFAQRSIAISNEGEADLPSRLTKLADMFKDRYSISRNISDVDQEIRCRRRAIEVRGSQGDGPMELAQEFIDLCHSLQERFLISGNTLDVDAAVDAALQGIGLTPVEDSRHFQLQHVHALLLNMRFERTGKMSDINRAIDIGKASLLQVPEQTSTFALFLMTLGNSYTFRFKYTGDMADIHDAIATIQKAILVVQNDPSALVACYDNLGVAFQCRFWRSEATHDLQEAVAAHRKSVDLISPDDPRRPARLNNLSTSLYALFGSTKDINTLNEAIGCTQEAVLLTADDHPFLLARLTNMATLRAVRFDLLKAPEDINEAVKAYERAIAMTPDGHASLPALVANLGSAYQSRYEQSHSRDDIDNAVTSITNALALLPDGHSEIGRWHNSLGHTYTMLYEATADSEYCALSLKHHRLGATIPASGPAQRLESAIAWSRVSFSVGSDECIEAFDACIALVALVAGLEQTLEERYRHLTRVSQLALNAAAVAFALQRPEKALEWLEQGRCLVWNQINHLRTPLDALREQDARLADEILAASRSLENAGARVDTAAPETDLQYKISLQEEASRHVQTARRWDELLERARAIPGFQNFLQPPSASTLLETLPERGPLIIINVHRNRCDAMALIAGMDEPIHIPLPDFSFKLADTYRRSMQKALASGGFRSVEDSSGDEDKRGLKRKKEGGRAGSGMQRILEGLWRRVVKPILDDLGFSPTEQPEARIWWSTTGPLAFLPIHAAGIYGAGADSICVSDYAISSYTPTVTALVERAKRTQRVATRGLFLLSAPDAPGMSHIPGTTEEIRAIKGLAQSVGIQVSVLEGSEAVVSESLDNMAKHGCIHLACHATQDAHDPLKSGFFLIDGRLDLSTIMKTDLKNAELAFLSACQTSTGDATLSEEAVHLAAGMLAAGYHGVVATMWSIADLHAPDVAREFYQHLFGQSGGGGDIDGDRAAEALHHAVLTLRRRLGDASDASFFAWVPYVHYGI